MKSYLKKIVKRITVIFVPFFQSYCKFKLSLSNHVSLGMYIKFRLRRNKDIYWPVHKNSEITHPQNIYVGLNSNAGTRPGCYLQGNGGIYIGNYVHFASNIGVISANHNEKDQMKHILKEVRIGDYTWIGMNTVILPGVVLGPRTIVGAGSVVTKSFPEGFCIIAGNPAKVIKTLDKKEFRPTTFRTECYGFIAKEEFVPFAKKHLRNNRYYQEMIDVSR